LNAASSFSVFKTLQICEITNKKMIISDTGVAPAMFEFVVAEQIESKYGGTAPDKVDHFFPATEVSSNYGFNKFRIIEERKKKNSIKARGREIQNKFSESGLKTFHKQASLIKEESEWKEQESSSSSFK
jgi:hypothetical protein